MLLSISAVANPVDSLITNLQTSSDINKKCEIMSELIGVYLLDSGDENAVAYKRQDILSELSDSMDIALFYENLGRQYLLKNKLNKSYGNIVSALDIYNKLNDEFGLARIHLLIGNFYIEIYDLKRALVNLEMAFKYSKLKYEPRIQIDALNGMSKVYIELNQYTEAESSLKKAKELSIEEEDTLYLCNTLLYQSKLYNAKHRFDKQITTLLKSITLAKQALLETKLADLYYEIALIYGERDAFIKSKEYLDKALSIYNKIDFEREKRGKTLNQLGYHFLVIGELELSRRYMEKALKIARFTNSANLLKNINKHFSQLCEKENYFQAALAYYKQYTQIKDSLSRNSRNPNIRTIQLELKNSEQSIKIQYLEHQAKSRKYIMIASSLASIFFLALLVVILTQNVRRRKINAKLLKQKDKAEAADKLKSAFLANMSHEIRSPMNAIIGFTDIMIDSDKLDSEQAQYLEYIKNSGSTLMQLVDDIIDSAKIEAGQLKIRKASFNLDKMMKGLQVSIKTSNSKLQKNNVDLNLNIPENKDCVDYQVVSDELRIRQIITNLISNAIKFTEKGFIEFGYKKMPNSELLFYTKDTGVGIEDKYKEIIFKRFGQVDDTYVRNTTGTGLGLAISKSLVTLLGGEIWFDSVVNKGTTFFFKIPVKFDDQCIDCEVCMPNEEKDYDWNNKLILIVEDDDINYKVAQALLLSTKVKLIRAANGKDAVEIALSNKNIDLILMDIQLPLMNGYEASKAIRKQSDVPIIVITAYAMPGEKDKSLKVGCNDFVTKPYNEEDLLPKIAKLI